MADRKFFSDSSESADPRLKDKDFCLKVQRVAMALALEYYQGKLIGNIESSGGKYASTDNEATRNAERFCNKWTDKAITLLNNLTLP